MTPSTTPAAKAMSEETSAITRSTRGAEIVREKMSMPETSVPIQCWKDGGRRPAPGNARSGSNGATAGPKSARKRVTPTMTRPNMTDGRRRAKNAKSRRPRLIEPRRDAIPRISLLLIRFLPSSRLDPRVYREIGEINEQEDDEREQRG